jgi:hypothetical protein
MLTWALASLPPRFVPLVEFCCLPDGIRILGVPFGFVSFAFFFLHDALVKEVWDANVLLRLRDVQMAFDIIF